MARAAKEKVAVEDNDRVNKLRQRVLCPPEVCIERGYLITESYRQTESEPPVIRRAKALEKVLKEMTISIDDGELIVGRATSKPRGGPLLPEVQWEWYLDEMDLLSTREWDRLAPLTDGEKAKMKQFLPYWKGRSLYDQWSALIPEDVLKLHHVIEEGGAYCANGTHFAHISPDYDIVINKGLNYIKKQVAEEIGKLNLADIKDFNKLQFLKAVNIALDAANSFANRYAGLVKDLAKKEANVERKAELSKIADACAWVPANPARNFYEALQSVWFIYVVLMIEGWGNGIGFGRPDQYLYPIYKKDVAEGKLTRNEACDLISMLYIKMNSVLILQASQAVKTFCGFATWANVTLGGLTKDGRDAVNELSYIFLDAEEKVRLSAEDIIIRVHKNTPDAFLMRACETLKTLRGKFKFVSDETTIQQLLSDGKPVDYARDYTICGCNCPTVPAYSHDLPGPIMNLPLMLELALNNGISRLTGKQIGPKTGDPKKFKTYEEVWDAYKKQVEALIPVALILKNVDKQIFAQFAPTPFQSALFHGCIEKGLDITNGGTSPYMTRAISLGGAPNVGDSLAAIKKVVFEDKKLSMDSLIKALEKNFEGEEKTWHILKSTPKFGNDDDYVDSIVNDVLVHGSAVAASNCGGVPGALSTVAAAIVTANVPLGQVVGALPDGRRSGEPLSEGGISPYQGRNVSGPTATMRSVAKLDHVKVTNGSVLNIRFNPDVLKDESKTRKFASLIRTFCETGGHLSSSTS